MRIANMLRITGAVVASMLLAGTAHALLFRAYLAPTGNDANDCTLPTPCRLLPAALAAVADGGEIWMLGSANYNTATVNITKSVSILAVPGVVGSVVATGGPAISIATAGISVSLRNLVIAPQSGAGGTDGIVMTNGVSLTVDNCLISNLEGAGLRATGAVRVSVGDTRFDNNIYGIWVSGGALITGKNLRLANHASGIYVFAVGSETSSLVLEASEISHGINGVETHTAGPTSRVDVTLANSVIAYNTGFAAIAIGDPYGNYGQHSINLVGNRIVNNAGIGVHISVPQFDLSSGRIILSGNTISRNNYGVNCNGGGIVTRDDNTIYDNVVAPPVNNCFSPTGYVHIGGS